MANKSTQGQMKRVTEAQLYGQTELKVKEDALSKDTTQWAYKTMNNIRDFEDTVYKYFMQGEIPGFLHLYAGEEAVATGVCAHLTDDDYITSTHRGHGHCIAKGCDLNSMMAEIFGKATGTNKGKGGSMHIADMDKGMLGANGMVGGGFGLGLGAGMSNKYLDNGNVSVIFFGDGASNEGNFHESMNMAKIWNLPVIFVCEMNYFAESTPQWYSSASDTIAERAKPYNIPTVRVDGKDFTQVYQAAGEAIERARNGEGPQFIEAVTYRNYGHFVGDEQKYKKQDGLEKEFADRDPITEFRQYALDNKLLTEKELDDIQADSEQAIKDAVTFAKESPEPDPSELFTDVYAD